MKHLEDLEKLPKAELEVGNSVYPLVYIKSVDDRFIMFAWIKTVIDFQNGRVFPIRTHECLPRHSVTRFRRLH